MRTKVIALLLLILGILQMVGDLTQIPELKGIAAATGASPAPKVFSSVRGLETFSSRFVVVWENEDGSVEELEITPEVNANLRGPYNRRNVYGAAISFGPVLAANPQTAPMLEAIGRYSFRDGAPLLKELLGRDDLKVRELHLVVIPREGTHPEAELPMKLGGWVR